MSDSIAWNVNPSNGSNINSYNLVPKSGKKYLVPFRVKRRCKRSAFISSSSVCVSCK